MLFVGDPGVAKSQLLRYMVKLAPRGVFASGKSASSSGLTAAAVKDEMGDGRWTLEAGALVMADMGIAAVDEMDKMRSEDKSALTKLWNSKRYQLQKQGYWQHLNQDVHFLVLLIQNTEGSTGTKALPNRSICLRRLCRDSI